MFHQKWVVGNPNWGLGTLKFPIFICIWGNEITRMVLYVQWSPFPNPDISNFLSLDGNWGQWTTIGSCSVTCGGGTQNRSRSCNNPAPSGGLPCLGSATSVQSCNNQSCVVSKLDFVCKWIWNVKNCSRPLQLLRGQKWILFRQYNEFEG